MYEVIHEQLYRKDIDKQNKKANRPTQKQCTKTPFKERKNRMVISHKVQNDSTKIAHVHWSALGDTSSTAL